LGEKLITDTDASNMGLEEHIAAYYSRTLSKVERNYYVTRWELLVTVKMLELSTYTSIDKNFTCTLITPP
jgi:hypothetical protein